MQPKRLITSKAIRIDKHNYIIELQINPERQKLAHFKDVGQFILIHHGNIVFRVDKVFIDRTNNILRFKLNNRKTGFKPNQSFKVELFLQTQSRYVPRTVKLTGQVSLNNFGKGAEQHG